MHRVVDAIAQARSIVALTGAGVSAESGLATFRTGPDAWWKGRDPMTLATPEAFERDPALVSEWYEMRRQQALAAVPNPGHLALARLQSWCAARDTRFTLLTQNVDRLHHRAGATDVIELHGTIMRWRCTRTEREMDAPAEGVGSFPIPSPFHSGGLMRPAVVWFGEALPEPAVRAAHDAVAHCDLFLSIGTSGVVYPAAGYLQQASARGVSSIEINPDQTQMSDRVTFSLRARSGEALPTILAMLEPH